MHCHALKLRRNFPSLQLSRLNQLAFLADSCNANRRKKMRQKFGMVHWDDVIHHSENASGRDGMREGREKREGERGAAGKLALVGRRAMWRHF